MRTDDGSELPRARGTADAPQECHLLPFTLAAAIGYMAGQLLPRKLLEPNLACVDWVCACGMLLKVRERERRRRRGRGPPYAHRVAALLPRSEEELETDGDGPMGTVAATRAAFVERPDTAAWGFADKLLLLLPADDDASVEAAMDGSLSVSRTC